MRVRVFFELLNMSLSASIIIVLVLCVRKLIMNWPKIFSYILWIAVIFRLLCPISFESQISIIPEIVSDGSLLENISEIKIGTHETYWNDTEEYKKAIEQGCKPIIVEDDGQASAYVAVESNEELQSRNVYNSIMPILSMIWLLGMIVFILYQLFSYIRLRRRMVGAIPYDAEEDIYFSDYIDTPFIIGFLYPRIYFPSSLEGEELKYILSHETEHIRRKDHIVKVLFCVALCIHWFNLLVWIAFIEFCKDMEMSCDEAVLRKLDSDTRFDYATSLLNMAADKSFIYGITIAFGESDIKVRIKNILKWKKQKALVIMGALIMSAGIFMLALQNPIDRTTEHPYEWSQNLDMKSINSYSISNWTDQVVYYYVSESQIADLVYILNEMKAEDYKKGNVLADCEITVNLACGEEVCKLTYGNETTMFSFEGNFGLDKEIWLTNNAQLTEAMKKIISESTQVSKELPTKNLAPTEEQVLQIRSLVLEGMSDEEKGRLRELIKAENLRQEYRYLEGGQFRELKEKDSLYWKTFTESGEIVVGYGFEQRISEDSVKSGLTEEAYNEKYGTPLVAEIDVPLSDEFYSFLDEIRGLLKNNMLNRDLAEMEQCMELAISTHDVHYLYQIFYKLHDMDYFLFRYGPEDVGPFVQDDSFVSLFYDSLQIYEGYLPTIVEAFNQELQSYYRMSDGTWRSGLECYKNRVEFKSNNYYYVVLSNVEDITLEEALNNEKGSKVVFSWKN